MKRLTRNGSVLLLTVLGLSASAIGQASSPAIPPTPAPVRDVLFVQPFDLATPAPHLWRAEQPTMRSGYLLVLEVDHALVFPRQMAEPVLYVGHQTAERVNVGYESGHVVAIVPAVIDPEHADYLDLSKELIWFGSPELPERVDEGRIGTEHEAATAAGITPFAPATIAAARSQGGTLNRQASKRSLLRDTMQRLVLRYSPQERSLVDGVIQAAD